MHAEKDAFRDRIRTNRHQRPAAERASADLAIAERGLTIAQQLDARTVACYLSSPAEPPTRALLDALDRAGIRILLPVVRPGRVLEWAQHDGSSRQTRLGVPETMAPPLGVDALARADLIFAPACAVDTDGYRLGWGGGFYDAALSGPGAGIPTYAVLYDFDVVTRVPREAHDVAIHGVITPTKTLTFHR